MEIIYVSSACNPSNIDEINKTAIKKLEISGIKFHNLLIKGFSNNGVKVNSIIGLPLSKITNKKVFWKKKIDNLDNITYNQVGFINIPIIKQLTTALNIFFTYIKYMKKKEEVYTIIDATYVSVLPFIQFANKFFKKKVIGIVADIYDYMCNVENSNVKSNNIMKSMRNKNMKRYAKLDGFILLTELMNEAINFKNKPYIVVEGCSDFNMNFKENNLENKYDKKVVMYSGKLEKKFGIRLLVESFLKLNREDSELWIFGYGEEEEYIKNIANKNDNIKFKGFVPNNEVVESQIRSTLLINPRPTNEEYTKYSFPSKNIEYMASGTPMLTTRLPGMPKEYEEYVYLFNEENVESMSKVLGEVLELSEVELNNKGIKAKEFIINNKNENLQAKKIIEFLKGV